MEHNEFNNSISNLLREVINRYSFRAPEMLEYPQREDLEDFRDCASSYSWYPLENPTVEQLQTIKQLIDNTFPTLFNITFLTLLDDIRDREIRGKAIAPKEIIEFFRGLGFGTHVRFKCDMPPVPTPPAAISIPPHSEPSHHSHSSISDYIQHIRHIKDLKKRAAALKPQVEEYNQLMRQIEEAINEIPDGILCCELGISL